LPRARPSVDALLGLAVSDPVFTLMTPRD